MEQKVVKLEITNNVNDSVQLEWKFFKTDEEKNNWIQEKRKEESEWNYGTSRSIRYYYFEEYLTFTLLDLDISELKGMKVRDFIKLFVEL